MWVQYYFMAEFKFACLHCGQKIQVDELWTGHELQCPICHKNLTVPPNPAAAPAPRPPATGAHAAPVAPGLAPVSAVAASTEFAGRNPPPGASLPPSRIASAPPRPQAATPQSARAAAAFSGLPKNVKTTKRSNAWVMKTVKIGAVVIVLGVGGYFGWGLVSSWQDKANKSSSNSGGGQGQVGHIQDLNNVLDATDPDRGRKVRLPPPDSPQTPRSSKMMAMQSGQTAPGQTPAKDLPPPLPAVWTLEVESAKIPEGRANGTLSGTNFLVESARIDTVGSAQVLTLRQGAGPTPDRDMLIYLHLAAGQNLATQKWTISKDMRGSAAPQVVKHWKVDPRYAPRSQSYAGGYAMKLEFGAMGTGSISGKIFLALPDTEQSVVAGLFDAVIGAPPPVTPAVMAPAPTPIRKVPTAGRTEMDKRYGISP